MTYWVTPQEMSELDRTAIANGTPGVLLMERAGAAVAETAERMLAGEKRPVLVLAGPGNNGGDGYVAARLLLLNGYPVSVHAAFQEDQACSPDCLLNRDAYRAAGGFECSEPPFMPSLIIDALLGTGFSGHLRGHVLKAIETFLPAMCPVLSVDCPTGVNGLTGEADAAAVRADVTVTFAAPKLGLFLPPGCGLTGSLYLCDIGIPLQKNHVREIMDIPRARSLLPIRPTDGHKGVFGKVLLLAGSERMPGAALLAALGALRSGAGLVEICVPLPAAAAVSGRIPETLCSYFLPGDVTSLPEPTGFSVAVAGPGLGNDIGTTKIVRYILENWQIPLVLDADALNVMDKGMADILPARQNVVLTPHPGELSRLTGCTTEIAKRFDAAAKLSLATSCPVLLKGKPSQVFFPDGGRILNPSGNHGMATGGSGDVLSGIVAGFIAQGLSTSDASALAAYVHGLAGDILASSSSPRSLLPTDVAGAVGQAFTMIEDRRNDTLLRLEGCWNGRLWNIPG
jgi:NAD(P)H-hydrate epimerase